MRSRVLTPPKRPLREAIQDERFWLRVLDEELRKRADEVDQKRMSTAINRLRDTSTIRDAEEYLQCLRTWYPENDPSKVPSHQVDN